MSISVFLDFSSLYHQINLYLLHATTAASCQFNNIIVRIIESFGGGLVVL
jgi:hypothetical protein